MTLPWDQSHDGAVDWLLFDNQWLCGQVVLYHNGYAAFRTGNRVEGGPWVDVDDAKAALEAAVNDESAPGRSRGR